VNGVLQDTVERRRHPRVQAAGMSYVVGLQMPGLVMDVSDGGIGVRYKGSEELPEEVVVDLINASKCVTIDGIRCRKTRDEKKGQVTGFSYVQERHLGLQFLEHNEMLISTLGHFKRLEV